MRLPAPYSDKGALNVIIETPKLSTCKFDFDPEHGLFKVAKRLPAGLMFPFDFGFIPGTLGEDGDPLDVMVLSQHRLFVSAWVSVRLIGVLEAEQTGKDAKKAIRNDRLIGCQLWDPDETEASFGHVRDLPQVMLSDITAFFEQYNHLHGNKFKPLGWKGPRRARSLIELGIERATQA